MPANEQRDLVAILNNVITSMRRDDEAVMWWIADIAKVREALLESLTDAAPRMGEAVRDEVDEVLAKLGRLARQINDEDADHLNASAEMLRTIDAARSVRNGLSMYRLAAAADGNTHNTKETQP